jgi:hypothetical protein
VGQIITSNTLQKAMVPFLHRDTRSLSSFVDLHGTVTKQAFTLLLLTTEVSEKKSQMVTALRKKLFSSKMIGNDLSMNHVEVPPQCVFLYISTAQLQNIFITETNNYTKKILQSHTDHSPNSRATNWKK